MAKRINSTANPADLVIGRWCNIPDVQQNKPVFVMEIDKQRTKTVVKARTENGDVYEIIMVALQAVEAIEKAIPLFEQLWNEFVNLFRKK